MIYLYKKHIYEDKYKSHSRYGFRHDGLTSSTKETPK